MPAILAEGSPERRITLDEKKQYLAQIVEAIGIQPQRVLLLPPDITRFYSDAGLLTSLLYDMFSPTAEVDVMPTLGTHNPMTADEIRRMFGDNIPLDRVLVHDWRRALVHLGDVPGDCVREWSEGKLDYDIRVEVNRRLVEGNYDLILSVGQIVPHEVVGMANYSKNICVGVGGPDTINKSHFLGAVHGMERIMGRADTPVRRVFNYGLDEFLGDLPIYFILTVMEKDNDSGELIMRGLYAGSDDAAFRAGCTLSQQVNLILLDRPFDKVVVYLEPEEFRSTWLGNKAVYRTRMAIADGGELIVLAPGLKEFGEDAEIDKLIRKYGYRGTPAILDQVKTSDDLGANLSAAAHLIHGSSEGRFTITYCPGPAVGHDEIRQVGFEAADLGEMLQLYNPETLKDGYNTMPDGEEIFYISNPALGLWALKENFAG